jgi:spore coat protein SA
MIYHVLPEWEEFSEYGGGAVSKNVANMMRFDASRVVVCRIADQSLQVDSNRVIVLSSLYRFSKVRARRFIPLSVSGALLRRMLGPLVMKLKPGDIVWCHSQPFFARAIGPEVRAAGAKLIYHAHSSLFTRKVYGLFDGYRPDAFIFVSDAMRDEAIRLLPSLRNAYTVYNGADETLFYPEAEASDESKLAPVVLYVGRLHPEKGPHVLIEAMRILADRKVSVKCKIIGSAFVGSTRATAYVHSLVTGSPPNVQFEGFRSRQETAIHFRRADVVCCPSIYEEPFGNVNVEAMACGVPVVASRVGGIPEIAAEGGVLLVEPNSPAQLADALQQLVTDRILRTTLGEQGICSFRRRFRWSVLADQYRDIAAAI